MCLICSPFIMSELNFQQQSHAWTFISYYSLIYSECPKWIKWAATKQSANFAFLIVNSLLWISFLSLLLNSKDISHKWAADFFFSQGWKDGAWKEGIHTFNKHYTNKAYDNKARARIKVILAANSSSGSKLGLLITQLTKSSFAADVEMKCSQFHKLKDLETATLSKPNNARYKHGNTAIIQSHTNLRVTSF